MRKTSFLLLFAAIIALGFSSCRKDAADADDILKTIPADASAVVVADLESIIEDAGCKIDGSKIIAGEVVKNAIGKADSRDKKTITDILDGKTGIDPSVAALFYSGGYGYFTGMLADPDQFRSYVEQNDSSKFTARDGVDVLGNVAVKGNRFWYALNPTIDARTVSSFTELAEKQSFASQPQAEDLHEISDDVTGWGNIAALMNLANVGFQQRSMLLMSLQTLFEDPQDIVFSLDFDKGKLEASLDVRNSKGKPARVSFPTDKIDLPTVNSIGGNARALVAGAFSEKFISQMKQALDKQGPNMFSAYIAALQCIDGTIAVGYDTDNDSYNAVISTTGKNTASLTDMLTQMGLTMKLDGKYLRTSKGTPGGKPVSELSAPLKGAMFGVVMTPEGSTSMRGLDNIRSMAFTLSPKDGSLRIEVQTLTTRPGENALVTMIGNWKGETPKALPATK